jgi:DNA invertase Pin-like site-specific DNA recombinase
MRYHRSKQASKQIAASLAAAARQGKWQGRVMIIIIIIILGHSEPAPTSAPSNWMPLITQLWMNFNST